MRHGKQRLGRGVETGVTGCRRNDRLVGRQEQDTSGACRQAPAGRRARGTAVGKRQCHPPMVGLARLPSTRSTSSWA
jgi:hypothetical protein